MPASKMYSETHCLHTYKFYPRPHYFQRRLWDLYPRFRRVIGSFPKSCQDEKRLTKIHECHDELAKPPKVIVIGNHELQFSRIVVTEAPLKDKHATTENGLAIILIYIRIDDVDASGIQTLDLVLQHCLDSNKQHIQSKNSKTLVLCDIEKTTDASRLSKIRSHIFSQLQLTFPSLPWDDRIIIGPDDVTLGSKISELLESVIFEVFEMMYDYIGRFLRSDRSEYTSKGRVIDDEEITKTLENLVRDAVRLHDMRTIAEQEQSAGTAGLAADKRFIVHVLNYLAKQVKDTVMGPFCLKNKLPPWICFQLLEEIDFTKKVKDSISNTTRSKLHRLDAYSAKKEKAMKTMKTANAYLRNDYMVTSLKNDMSEAFAETEKTMASIENILNTLEKMRFEIRGYFGQTTTREKQKETRPVLTEELRTDILKLSSVFGTGIFYDKLEVHVSQSSNEVKSAVTETLQKHGFTKPYTIKLVVQEPKQLAGGVQYEHGIVIKGEHTGTLGGFVEDVSNNLYALTCAHVISNNDQSGEHDVFTDDSIKFGVSKPLLTVNTGDSPEAKLVDIAAIRVADNLKQTCIRYLKNDEDDGCTNKQSVLGIGLPWEIDMKYGSYVYKFGAETQFTKGVISCNYFVHKLNNSLDTDYLMVIEPQPGSPDTPTIVFAKSGDSGSLVCAPDPNSDSIIALAMVSSGELKFGNANDKQVLAFQLSRGLQALEGKSGLQLSLPIWSDTTIDLGLLIG